MSTIYKTVSPSFHWYGWLAHAVSVIKLPTPLSTAKVGTTKTEKRKRKKKETEGGEGERVAVLVLPTPSAHRKWEFITFISAWNNNKRHEGVNSTPAPTHCLLLKGRLSSAAIPPPPPPRPFSWAAGWHVPVSSTGVVGGSGKGSFNLTAAISLIQNNSCKVKMRHGQGLRPGGELERGGDVEGLGGSTLQSEKKKKIKSECNFCPMGQEPNTTE